MSERFYTESPIDTDRATLADAEAHHLLHVMRLKVGDPVTVFDGGGAEFDARVALLGRRHVELEVTARREVDREAPAPLRLAVALPKGDRQKWLVEKLTELGVTSLTPLATERSVAAPTPGGLDKLRRVVVEASKQCGRNRLMRIDEPLGWDAFLGASSDGAAGGKLIAHPGGGGPTSRGAGPVLVAVGPEGGFTDDEVAAAERAGFTRLGLGAAILRVETAAVAAATLAGAWMRGDA